MVCAAVARVMSAPRLATPSDRAAVERLVREAYSPYLPRLDGPPGPMLDDYAVLIERRQVWVLDAEGGLAGLVVLIAEADATLLDNVAVAPAMQGRGVGRRLVAFAEQMARQAGHRTLRLYTNVAMTENVALYRRLGFAETHRGRENGFDRVFMRKDVAP